MEDIAPQLIEAVTDTFRKAYDRSDVIRDLLAKVKKGTATYAEAQDYALEVSRLIGKAYEVHVSSAVLPEGRMFYNIASRLIPQTLDEDYRLVADYAADVQRRLNEHAGIGLRAQVADKEPDRIDGLVELASGADRYDDVAAKILAAFDTFSQSVVDGAIRKNAELHYRSGLSPKIMRKAERKCCDWCQGLAGEFDYPEVPEDIYRRHERCRCTVLYDPADGSKKLQDVHSKQWTEPADRDKLEKRKRFSELGFYDATPEKGASTKDGTDGPTRKVYTKRQLESMPLEELREYVTKCATEWYESGNSGISFPPGKSKEEAARQLAAGASKASLQKDAKALQERLIQLDAQRKGQVTQNAFGHQVTVVSSPTLNGIPDSITQTVSRNGSISRNYYDSTGIQVKQISNDDHGEQDPKRYGQHGEHAHDYKYGDTGGLESRPKRELTDEERKENEDIL